MRSEPAKDRGVAQKGHEEQGYTGPRNCLNMRLRAFPACTVTRGYRETLSTTGKPVGAEKKGRGAQLIINYTTKSTSQSTQEIIACNISQNTPRRSQKDGLDITSFCKSAR